ncbi:MAG: hypothetical protein PHC65_03095 [Methanobacteriaceae archaeon]|jgi:hypothetical protein|uniref:hypothetical protein n=1 Tax=unclassified Methanobrevibacter TaxID=2638681 RepID=UPI002A137E2D|nr:hypothetical protein [Methanobacteriaceae archaeon]MDD3408397.1 hypothetical protein [Methanobacteriaceae archaeon]MDD4594306.1 hypothetical protein [Methanobacteriaceae archaeon]
MIDNSEDLKNKALDNKVGIRKEYVNIIVGDEEQSFKIAGIGQKAVKLEKYIKYDDIMEAVESGHEDGLEAIIKKIIEDYEPPAEEE